MLQGEPLALSLALQVPLTIHLIVLIPVLGSLVSTLPIAIVLTKISILKVAVFSPKAVSTMCPMALRPLPSKPIGLMRIILAMGIIIMTELISYTAIMILTEKVRHLHLLVLVPTLSKTMGYTPLWAMGKRFVLERLVVWQMLVICLLTVSSTMFLYLLATTNFVQGNKMLSQTVVSPS